MRIYSYGVNTTITVTGYLGATVVKTVTLNVTPNSAQLESFYLGLTGVDSVKFVSDKDWFFAIDDLGIAPTPTVTGIAPTAGPAAGGTSVVITGTGILGVNAPAQKQVKFGATATAAPTVNSDTQITVAAPAGTGTVDVTVTTAGAPAPPVRPTSTPTSGRPR